MATVAMDTMETMETMETNIKLTIIVDDKDYKNITLEVDGSYTMDNIKEMIQEKTGTAPRQQKLYYDGKEVRDTDIVYDLKYFWEEDGKEVDIEMCCCVVWLLPMTTAERDASRSRSPRRELLLWRANFSDLGNENCIF